MRISSFTTYWIAIISLFAMLVSGIASGTAMLSFTGLPVEGMHDKVTVATPTINHGDLIENVNNIAKHQQHRSVMTRVSEMNTEHQMNCCDSMPDISLCSPAACSMVYYHYRPFNSSVTQQVVRVLIKNPADNLIFEVKQAPFRPPIA